MSKKITLFHFNDVYNVSPRSAEPVGGASRFVSLIRSKRQQIPHSLTVFAGDVFNPSLLSTITQGEHMIPVLQNIGIDVACIGNHDFDFGEENLQKLCAMTSFPWLLSNCKVKDSKRPLANANEFFITELPNSESSLAPSSPIRIGWLGLVEQEWMATLAVINQDDIDFEDFSACAIRLGQQLRQQHHVDFVIAITHMRYPNDLKLAHDAGHVLDIVLGGHDHDAGTVPVKYGAQDKDVIYVVKSGTDFRELSQVQLMKAENDTKISREDQVIVDRFPVNKDITPDPQTDQWASECEAMLGKKLDLVLAQVRQDLEGRFAKIRTQETNLSNLCADIMMTSIHPAPDFAFFNSGTLRIDQVIPKGPFTLKDLVSLLPMMDETVMISIKGSQVIDVLENAVSMYPKLEGRFLCVSGIRFEFDPRKPPKQRVSREKITIQGVPLDLDKHYSALTKAYLAEGKDGFDVLKDCKVLIDAEICPVFPTMARNYLTKVNVLRTWAKEVFPERKAISAANHMLKMLNKDQKETEERKVAVKEIGIEAVVDGRILNLCPQEV